MFFGVIALLLPTNNNAITFQGQSLKDQREFSLLFNRKKMRSKRAFISLTTGDIKQLKVLLSP